MSCHIFLNPRGAHTYGYRYFMLFIFTRILRRLLSIGTNISRREQCTFLSMNANHSLHSFSGSWLLLPFLCDCVVFEYRARKKISTKQDMRAVHCFSRDQRTKKGCRVIIVLDSSPKTLITVMAFLHSRCHSRHQRILKARSSFKLSLIDSKQCVISFRRMHPAAALPPPSKKASCATESKRLQHVFPEHECESHSASILQEPWLLSL